MRTLYTAKILVILLASVFLNKQTCHALLPEEVLVVANINAPSSIGLAKYYMEKRNIPSKNILVLWVSNDETVSRENYEKKIAAPIKKHLAQPSNHRIRCVVLLYGLPLRIAPPTLTSHEKLLLAKLNRKKKNLKSKLLEQELEEEDIEGVQNEIKDINARIKAYKKKDHGASVDSELTLVKVDNYPLKAWLPNPAFIGFKDKKLPISISDIILTSRLDGPSDIIVKRIINDSLAAEKVGLKGNACFDARWPMPPKSKRKKAGYGFYDQSLHLAAERLQKNNSLNVIVNAEKGLMQRGDCEETALYCGWYSLGKYVDAFTWQTGAIGFHIASSECTTLKRKNSQVWCKKMLEKGAAATIGPVNEPYVQAFPVPEIFFTLLTESGLTLGESYIYSLPYLSWQMVLVGDPLYRPFKDRDQGNTTKN